MVATPQRATGANVKLRLRFETAYGERAVGNYVAMAAYTFGLSKQQPLENDPLLGAGRDPLAPSRGAIDVNGPATIPIDQRLIGYWLKLLLAAPTAEAADGARGWISFNVNPSNGQTIVLDGQTWTFVTGSPSTNETQIAATLALTLADLVDDLNASVVSEIAAATYSTYGDRLAIDHDTADASGNAYTLASAIPGIKRSAATLVGGGLIRHDYVSGSATLPSASLETEHADLEGGSDRFIEHAGTKLNSLSIERTRSGAVKASVALIAQSETAETATAAGTPAVKAIDLFSQFHGYILVDGVRAGNVVAANYQISNNLDVVNALREDGLIEGADAGQTGLTLSLTVRYSNTAMRAAAESGLPVECRTGFYNSADGAELLFNLHELHLPIPRREINGPGGIEVTYEGIGAQDVSIGRALSVSLWNDLANYDNPA
jgi:hypothetical protein